jgi:hypothetical protein
MADRACNTLAGTVSEEVTTSKTLKQIKIAKLAIAVAMNHRSTVFMENLFQLLRVKCCAQPEAPSSIFHSKMLEGISVQLRLRNKSCPISLFSKSTMQEDAVRPTSSF